MVCEYCNGSGRANHCKVIAIDEYTVTAEIKEGVCPICNGRGVRPMTNADRIRAMSDEDLAAWIAGMTTVCECCAELNECEAPRGFNRCSHGVEDWLKQPAEEVDDG